MQARKMDPCAECERNVLCNECEVTMKRDGTDGLTIMQGLQPMKTCSKCGFDLPLTPEYFHRSKTKKSGYQSVCKNCKSGIDRQRRDATKGEVKLQNAGQTIKHSPTLGAKSIDALYALLDRMEAEERETLRAKGNDYSGENRLANFERIAAELNLKPEQILWIYFKKHTDRLRTYITEGAVSSESVVGSIMDCRNYLALLRLMIEAKS